jgi:hypothetical protein
VGCTDGYIAHLEKEFKIPSLSLSMALSEVFGLTDAQRNELLEAVEAMRVERSGDRVRTRGAAVRGALRTRGSVSESSDIADPLDPDRIASEITRNPKLKDAYGHLRKAFFDRNMRDTVLRTLKALADSVPEPDGQTDSIE